jgi:RAMA domain-containing protein
MEVDVVHSGLRMVLVSRESIGLLDESWRVLGVYFLIGAGDDPDRYRAYVGEVGKSTLVQRVRQHTAKKEWFSRALLIASASGGFNSAEIGWLEGRLFDVLNNAVACDVMNGNRPGDDSLSLHQRSALERYVDPIMAALRACGAPPDTADQKPARTPRRTHTHHHETVADLVKAGLLMPETKLQPLRKGRTETATVLSDGRLRVGGSVHETPSAAAKAVAGTNSEPGWDFWGAPSGAGGFVPLAALRARLQDDHKPPDGPGRERQRPSSAAEARTLATVVRGNPRLFPLPIQAVYRGTVVEGTITAGGMIEYNGKTYTSPSAAANDARVDHGFEGAARVRTNGWKWWYFTDRDGRRNVLDVLRQDSPSSP